MSTPKHPPKGYVYRDEWLSLYERSDPGDIAKPVHVKFIPHRLDLPDLIEMVSRSEANALIAEARAETSALEKVVSAAYEYMKDFDCQANCDPDVGFHAPECCIVSDFKKALAELRKRGDGGSNTLKEKE